MQSYDIKYLPLFEEDLADIVEFTSGTSPSSMSFLKMIGSWKCVEYFIVSVMFSP